MAIKNKTAQKYFGESNPIGKTLTYNKKHILTITGVMKNIPANTHIPVEMFVSYSSFKSMGGGFNNSWSNIGNVNTYILVSEGVRFEPILEKMHNLLKKNDEILAEKLTFSPVKLTDIHFHLKCLPKVL